MFGYEVYIFIKKFSADGDVGEFCVFFNLAWEELIKLSDLLNFSLTT